MGRTRRKEEGGVASFPDRLIQLQHGDIVFRSCDWAQGGGGISDRTSTARRAHPPPLPPLTTYICRHRRIGPISEAVNAERPHTVLAPRDIHSGVEIEREAHEGGKGGGGVA